MVVFDSEGRKVLETKPVDMLLSCGPPHPIAIVDGALMWFEQAADRWHRIDLQTGHESIFAGPDSSWASGADGVLFGAELDREDYSLDPWAVDAIKGTPVAFHPPATWLWAHHGRFAAGVPPNGTTWQFWDAIDGEWAFTDAIAPVQWTLTALGRSGPIFTEDKGRIQGSDSGQPASGINVTFWAWAEDTWVTRDESIRFLTYRNHFQSHAWDGRHIAIEALDGHVLLDMTNGQRIRLDIEPERDLLASGDGFFVYSQLTYRASFDDQGHPTPAPVMATLVVALAAACLSRRPWKR